MSEKAKCLIVEDHEKLRNSIVNELRTSSMIGEILTVGSGEKALELFEQEPGIGMVVLDLDLTMGGGQMYGMEVLSRIRETSTVPVVILTSNTAPARCTEAVDKGADGYLPKEWYGDPIQIRLYLETVLERSRKAGHTGCWSFEEWTLDAPRRQLLNPDGADVTLTEKEFRLLFEFVTNPQTALTQETLIERLGLAAGKNPEAALATVVKRLRRKIDRNRQTSFILNVRGRGYHFAPAVLSAPPG